MRLKFQSNEEANPMLLNCIQLWLLSKNSTKLNKTLKKTSNRSQKEGYNFNDTLEIFTTP
jgi:hypothetical protein